LREILDIGVAPLSATAPDLLRWWNGTSRHAPNTRLNRLAVVKAFYKAAIGAELVMKDPTWAIKPVRHETVIPTPALKLEQAERLAESIRAEFDHPERALVARRDYAVVALALRMCLRAAEVAGLTWDCVLEDEGQRSLRFLGKFQKIAELAIPDDVWTALVDWRTEIERQTGARLQQRDPIVLPLSQAAFRNARDRHAGIPLAPISSTMISTIAMNRLCDIGLVTPRMAAHALRATGATLARKGGADLVELQALLRHASLNTTRLYLKGEDEHATPGMERMQIRLDGRDEKGATA
jgi:integrase